MFNRKKPAGIEQTRLATLIAHDVHIVGDLQFADGLRLDGHVKGDVSSAPGSQTLLVLSEHGSIEGNVHGHDVVVNGRIVGDLVADHFVELQGNAHVTGNITYQQLRIDVGASVDGKLTKRAQAALAAPLLTAEPTAPVPSADPSGGVEPDQRNDRRAEKGQGARSDREDAADAADQKGQHKS